MTEPVEVAPEVVLVVDGGGEVLATRALVRGADRVAALLTRMRHPHKLSRVDKPAELSR